MTVTDPGSGPAGAPPDEVLKESTAAGLVPAEIAAQSLPEYFRALWLRLKSGESGVLPVILSIVIVYVVFWVYSPHHVFMSRINQVNLLQQSAVFMVLAMAEMFALLLGEIDLSLGFLGAVGGTIAIQLTEPGNTGWPWWLSIIVALLAVTLAGVAQGLIITVLRIPSFIVTLAGYLIWNGVLLIVLAYGPYSGYPSLNGIQANLRYLRNLMNANVTPVAGWISLIVLVGLYGTMVFFRDERRRRSGLEAPPRSLTILKIGLVAAIGVVLVVVCNLNRGPQNHKIEGVPYFVYIVLAVLAATSFLLARTRYGRYVYAIGGNAEAARRAGINVTLIRTVAFGLAGMTAGIAMILYGSYIGGMSNNVNGGQLVLYAVAAAVIGGTSLFGGRGKMAYAVLGGLLIGAINNGLFLNNFQAQWLYIITGCVLLFAVMIDALARRGASSGSATRV